MKPVAESESESEVIMMDPAGAHWQCHSRKMHPAVTRMPPATGTVGTILEPEARL